MDAQRNLAPSARCTYQETEENRMRRSSFSWLDRACSLSHAPARSSHCQRLRASRHAPGIDLARSRSFFAASNLRAIALSRLLGGKCQEFVEFVEVAESVTLHLHRLATQQARSRLCPGARSILRRGEAWYSRDDVKRLYVKSDDPAIARKSLAMEN